MMRQGRIIALATASVAAFSGQTIAQDARDGNAAAEGAASSPVLEMIVVTAQKREENLQDVPVAVSAVTGEALIQKGITQFSELTQISPSLTLTVGVQPANSSVVLRGVGTLAFSTGVEPSVAILVDDLPVLQQAQAFANMSDIARVEVLRGPQGTLFGKNSSAGVINIVTEAPSSEFEGFVNGSLTDDGQQLIEGGINVPMGDRVAARASVFWQDNDGFIDNLHTGTSAGGSDSWGARVRLNAQLTENLNFDLGMRRTVDETQPAQTFVAVPDTGRIFNVPVVPNIVGITPGIGNDQIRYTFNNQTKNETTAVSGKFEWDVGFASLVSVSGYQKWEYFTFIDADNLAAPIFGAADGVFNGSPFETELWTEELRLVSGGGGFVEYLVGFYYSDGETTRDFLRFPLGSPQANDWSAENTSETKAVFAQVTTNITETTHVDIGARYNEEDISVRFVDRVLPVPAPTAGNCLTSCSGDSSQSKFTYKLALRQDLTDRIMAYISYGTGYKGQAYDISSGFNPTKAANPVNEENSKAYELGVKSRFFDDRVQLNAAVFYAVYEDFQAQSQVQLPNGTNAFNLNNVGELRTQGVELEATMLPLDSLTLGMTTAYVDAEMTSFSRAQCYPGQTASQGCIGGFQDLSGYAPPNSPEFRYTLSANYEHDLSSALDAFVRMEWRHQSETTYDLLQNPVSVQDAYGILDLSVGLSEAGYDRYNLTLFVKNVLDDEYAATILAPAGGNAGLAVQALARDYRRYFGVRAGFKF